MLPGKCGLEVRVLITGNLGYVGTVLSNVIRQNHGDWTIHGLDSELFAHCVLPEIPLPDGVFDRQISRDLRDAVKSDFNGVDAVIHLGAVSNDPIGNEFESATVSTNIDALKRVAVLASSAGVSRFVFASSCSVYGKNETGDCDEGSQIAPISTYAKSKVEAEEFLRTISNSDFQVISLRFATACGFSPRWRTDLVLNEFVFDAVETGTVRVLSDGSPWRPLIHVQDMSRAMLWALSHELAEPESYLAINAGSSGWNYQIRDLAEAVSSSIPGSRVVWSEDGKPDPRSYKVDFSLFQRLAPNHQPVVSLDQAIREMAAGIDASKNLTATGFSMRRLDELRRLIREGLLSRDLRWTDQRLGGRE